MIRPGPFFYSELPGAPQLPPALANQVRPTQAEADAIRTYKDYFKNVGRVYPELAPIDTVNLWEAYYMQVVCVLNFAPAVASILDPVYQRLDDLTVAMNRGFRRQTNRERMLNNGQCNLCPGRTVVMFVGPNNEEIPEHLAITNHDSLGALTMQDIDPILAFYEIVVSDVFEEDEEPDLLQRKRAVLRWYLLSGGLFKGAEGPSAF